MKPLYKSEDVVLAKPYHCLSIQTERTGVVKYLHKTYYNSKAYYTLCITFKNEERDGYFPMNDNINLIMRKIT
jgi:hypothetical protein